MSIFLLKVCPVKLSSTISHRRSTHKQMVSMIVAAHFGDAFGMQELRLA